MNNLCTTLITRLSYRKLSFLICLKKKNSNDKKNMKNQGIKNGNKMQGEFMNGERLPNNIHPQLFLQLRKLSSVT